MSDVRRAITVPGLLNVRDLGGLTTAHGQRVRSGHVIRSDNLRGMTDQGASSFFRTFRPRLVIDLRTEDECAREGRGLAHVPELRYVNVALQPKAAISPEQVAAGLATNLYDDYRLQIRDNGQLLLHGLDLLSREDHLPAVVHCTAGKDRTGVLVALLLDLLGVRREQVVADYTETTKNMPAVLDRIRASPYFRSTGLTVAPDWLFCAEPETMAKFLAWLDDTHGGSERWARAGGLSGKAVARLRANLLEPDR